MKLTLPLPPNRANARQNWRVALAAKKAYWQRLDVVRMCHMVPDPPAKAPSKVRVRSTFYLWNPMDDDNAVARLKPTIDWLRAWGYIRNDDRRHMRLEMPEQRIERKNQRLEIEIEETP